jgi:diguanylate cyclase (GGDEF)-like protein
VRDPNPGARHLWSGYLSPVNADYEAKPRSWLFGPMAGLAAGALGLLVLLSVFLVQRFDRAATEREEQMVENGFAVVKAELNRVVATQVEWDGAIANLDNRFDPDWADFNIGNYLNVFYGFSNAYVLGPDNRAIYASAKGERADLATYAPFQAAAESLLPEVRAKERVRPTPGKRPGKNNIIIPSIQASRIALVDGRPYIVSATLVQPDFGEDLPKGPRAPVAIAVKPIDQVMLKTFANRYLLEDLVVRSPEAISAADGKLVLSDRAGTPIAAVTWVPQRPGTMLLTQLAAPLILLLGMLAALAWRVIERGSAVASDLIASEARAKHAAFHDSLTRLPNRAYLFERLGQSLRRVEGPETALAVLCVDLDRFKEVNDTLGHNAGDALLEAMAERLRQACSEAICVARLGGDEFVVLLETSDEAAALVLGRRIVRAVSERVVSEYGKIEVACSIGLAYIDQPGVEPSEALRWADVALYRSKQTGGRRVSRFSPDMDQALRHRLQLEVELREAIGTDQFSMVYQPHFDRRRTLKGYEALLRWNHPERGAISPSVFVPLAEDSGLIMVLGEHVLRQVFAETRHWRGVKIAINVSAVQLRARGFAAQVMRIIAASGANPRSYEIEVTETALLGDDQETISNIDALKRMGFTIALDDFGTGFSSLNVLQRFSVDKIKIDCSFVAALGAGRGSEALIDAIVNLARGLDMIVVAEGVETEAQWDHLLKAGCRQFQGHLLGRPQPAAAIDRALPALRSASAA